MVKRDMSEREGQPRVSASGVIAAEEAVSSSRNVVLPDVPSRWLDRLLAAAAELPVTQGDVAVARAVLDAVGASLAPVSLGAVLVSPGKTEVISLGESAAAPGSDGRIFPAALRERIARVPDGSGSTLHVAASDGSLDDDAGAPVQLLHRAAFVVRGGLAAARAHARSVELEEQSRRREALLIQTEKLATLGQLAAGMVHELNNPLTSIVAYNDLLAKRAASRSPQEPDEVERLRRIGESAQRMLRFTRDLVQYARPIDVRGPVVLSSVIEQALSFCEHLLGETGVEVDRRLGDGVLPVRGAPEQLAQVFVNLITNACHAMPRGGRLVVATEVATDESCVRIAIEDDGEGIDRANLERIFEPFFTTKTDGRGSGLGLSIVRSIMSQHEGTIEVESETGRGTRFVLTLPVAVQDRPSRA